MPKKYNINHKDICLFLETQFFIVEITANGGQTDVRVYPPCAEGPARKKPVRDNSMAIKRKRGIHLKKAHTLIHCAALCMALLTAVQVLPGNGTLNARAQDTVTADAPGDGDAMHVMNLAGDGQLTDNLLGAWGGWSKGYTRETIEAHDGTQKSVYKAVAPTAADEAGLTQTLSAPAQGTYVLSGWSKAQNVIRGVGTEYFSYCLAVYVGYTDGTAQWFYTGFSLGTHDWEFRDTSFTLQKPAKSMNVYAFLRNPIYGTAWFDDITLRMGQPDATSTFQNLPVQVLQTAPEQGTKKTLKTKDGLELGLGDSVVTSLKIDGTELANNAYSGFLVRDVAAAENTGVYAFSPASGSAPAAFKGSQASLGLSLNADYTAEDDHIAVSGVIKDATAAADGRAVQLSYALPVTASGWKWGVSIQKHRDIAAGGVGDIYKELGEGEMSVVDWDSMPRSMYPTSVIYNEDLGLAIAVSMDFPAYYELEYNGSTGQYVLTYHLGIVPEAPDAARFSFVIYKLDDPAWGFRAAMEKYTRIFPEYYEVRETDQGMWVAWTQTSNVPQPEDFNFKFKEEGGEYFRIEGFYEMEHGIKGYQYIEPGDWWLKNMPSFPDDAMVQAAVKEQAGKDVSVQATRQAIATAICQGLNPLGKTNWTPVNVPWAPNGAQIHINANPKLPGAYNFYNLYLSKEQQDLLFDPLQCTTVPFDGIYLDELSGWWNGNANFNKAHYQYTTVPLTYSPYYKKPMLHRASNTWEFVKQLNTDLHARGKTIFANKCPDKTSFYTPLIDAMGTEMTALNGSIYAPQSIESMSMWRTLSYQKPFCILLSNDYTKFDHDMMEKYFQRCLAFGIFPSPQANYSDDLQYWTSRELFYERDRDIFQTYMPVLKTVAEAGWEPVTRAVSDNSRVLVERFGANADEGVYFTLFNDTAESQAVKLDVALDAFGLKDGCAVRELVSGQQVTLADGVYSVSLEPSQTVVLAINNPSKPPEESSQPQEESQTPSSAEDSSASGAVSDSGGADTGEGPVALLSAAGLAVLAAGTALTVRKKRK